MLKAIGKCQRGFDEIATHWKFHPPSCGDISQSRQYRYERLSYIIQVRPTTARCSY